MLSLNDLIEQCRYHSNSENTYALARKIARKTGKDPNAVSTQLSRWKSQDPQIWYSIQTMLELSNLRMVITTRDER